jgi:hypothetical protein
MALSGIVLSSWIPATPPSYKVGNQMSNKSNMTNNRSTPLALVALAEPIPVVPVLVALAQG